MATPVLTPDEVRTYIQDFQQNNYLLNGEEFSDIQILLANGLAVSAYNMIPPLSTFTTYDFPMSFKSILMEGTLWKMFSGASALLARNHMEYSDGGLTVPIEERMQLYTSLAGMYQESFLSSARAVKTHLNIEDGWDSVSSDQAGFPIW